MQGFYPLVSHCIIAVMQHMKKLWKRRQYEKAKWNKLHPNHRKKNTRVSVSDLEAEEQFIDSRSILKYSISKKFIPGLFASVWSCGHIAGISKMDSFESHSFITQFLIDIKKSNWQPNYIFYDKACQYIPSLFKDAKEKGECSDESELYEYTTFVVDFFISKVIIRMTCTA